MQEWISTGRSLMQSRDELCHSALIACHGHVAEGMPLHEGALCASRSITWRTLHVRKSILRYLISLCRKGIWLKLPLKHAQLVPVATSWGFYPHHAGASPAPSTFPIARMQTHRYMGAAFLFNVLGPIGLFSSRVR